MDRKKPSALTSNAKDKTGLATPAESTLAFAKIRLRPGTRSPSRISNSYNLNLSIQTHRHPPTMTPSLYTKIKSAVRAHGFRGLAIQGLERKLGTRLPLPPRLRWSLSIQSEVRFWDEYFKTKGAAWGQDYQDRLNPETALDKEIAELIPPGKTTVQILDVGAGPLTYLGKKLGENTLDITAVDPLADEFDKILRKYGITPLVRTKRLAAESLSESLPANKFDLAFARNCIDHTYSPERSILEMLKVTKPGHSVLLIHSQNEAIKERWEGLHQWNFSMSNADFIISSKTDSLNFSQKHSHLCSTSHTYDAAKDWIHVRLKKRE